MCIFQVFLYVLTLISDTINGAFSVDHDIVYIPPHFEFNNNCIAINCHLSKEDFRLLQTNIIAFVAIMSGLGAELFFGPRLLMQTNEESLQWFWIYANLLFPLYRKFQK